MKLSRTLSVAALAAVSIAPATAAMNEQLTGMPLFPNSTPVSNKLVEMKMGMCTYTILTKSYNVTNADSKAAPAWFAKTIPAAIRYPYSAGGVDGIAMFSRHGDGMVHIEPGLLIYYKFTPSIPTGRYAAVAKGGC